MSKNQETANQYDLGKLGAIIQQIVSVAKDFSGKATVKYDTFKASLIVRENASLAKILPSELYAKFSDANRGGTEEKEESLRVDSGILLYRYMIRDDLPFTTIIYCGIDKGFRQIFRNILTNLGNYRVLYKSLKALSVNVLQGR